MDELWQRYRTFWMPVLIGLGAFLVGVIIVHMITPDPERERRLLKSEQNKLKRMKVPRKDTAGVLRERTAGLNQRVVGWGPRLDQTGTAGEDLVSAGAEQVLRAVLLRGASADEAKDPRRMAARFDDDPVAAARAKRRFDAALQQHVELLRTGDPNVAFTRLLSEAWTELRIRANRADMELVDSLGFGTVSSVSRATLPGRVLTLALVSRVVDNAIRNNMGAISRIGVESNLRPGGPGEFLSEWPVTFDVSGPYAAVMRVLDEVTDPVHPIPIVDATTIDQPRGKRAQRMEGDVLMSITLASVVARPDVDLGLEQEEQQ